LPALRAVVRRGSDRRRQSVAIAGGGEALALTLTGLELESMGKSGPFAFDWVALPGIITERAGRLLLAVR
jgi:hypothetical protein